MQFGALKEQLNRGIETRLLGGIKTTKSYVRVVSERCMSEVAIHALRRSLS
jgi:hypothetical protein